MGCFSRPIAPTLFCIVLHAPGCDIMKVIVVNVLIDTDRSEKRDLV
jgi:hypothetical protein